MRIFDENNDEVLNPDFSKGYGIEERVLVAHHEAQETVVEEFHYDVLREYPNGGKDVKKVVDIPGHPAREAWDEYEEILRWHWYTPEEIEEQERKKNAPTQLDRVEAQVTYTAMMTDTLLPEEEDDV